MIRLIPSWQLATSLLLGLAADRVNCESLSFVSRAKHGEHLPSDPYTDVEAYQGFLGATNVIDLGELVRTQAAAGWTEDFPSLISPGAEINYSVIVVEWRTHPSNLFRDQERVRAFASSSEKAGGFVGSVQFASPFPGFYDDSGPPFNVGHPEEADKRVRVVHATDLVERGFEIDPRQFSHLEAACQDPGETTVLVMVDEICQRPGVPKGMPAACTENVVRIYPFNNASPDVWSQHAYSPLGPRDTFPFVMEKRRRPASHRYFMFNLKVTSRTSERRDELIAITEGYTTSNPHVPCSTSEEMMDSKQWQDLLLDSKFTLSPGGHNAETFRTWEALEAGSIPIVSKLDFTDPPYNAPDNCGVGPVAWNVVAGSPFAKEVSVNDWTELPALLDRLRREPAEYIDRLQTDCAAWYAAFMKRTYASLLNFGEGEDLFPQDGPLVDFGDMA
ncbi:unnamed protein product [Scytosiphon promiscuus]